MKTLLVTTTETARTFLQWHPAYAELDTIITTAWRWHQREQRS